MESAVGDDQNCFRKDSSTKAMKVLCPGTATGAAADDENPDRRLSLGIELADFAAHARLTPPTGPPLRDDNLRS